MSNLKKRFWTHSDAKWHIVQVNKGKLPMGLTYCSACDFLGIPVRTAATMKRT